MAKPTIRFKGYTDDWEQRKLGEITELKSASRVHKDEWTSNGVPFYRSSDVMAAINGTENEKAFISEELYEKLSKVSGKLEEGDILVTGGGSVGNPYIVLDNKPLYTKDADLLWIKNKGKFHPYFLYEFFFSPTFRNYLRSISHVGTIAHYTITQLSDTPIYLPSFEEQKEVGEYFQSLDHLITLHQRKCEETKILKKYMLQKMFPQNEQKVPEIRFKGFTDDWEQRKVSEMFKVTRGYVLPATETSEEMNNEMPYPVYSSQTKDNGLMGYYGDYLYEDAITWTTDGANAGTVNFRAGKFYCTNVCGVLLSDKIEASKAVAEALNSVAKKYVSYVGNPKLMNNVMAEIQISVPSSKEERDKISSFFGSLDHLITLHQRKCEELQKIKKFMLQNMFV